MHDDCRGKKNIIIPISTFPCYVYKSVEDISVYSFVYVFLYNLGVHENIDLYCTDLFCVLLFQNLLRQ